MAEQEIRRLLAEGLAPAEVFAQVAAAGGDGRAVALAVCLALGIPRAEAEKRLGEADPEGWRLDGDEQTRAELAAVHGELLAAGGTFDPVVTLDPAQRQIAALLNAAIAELTAVRGGPGDSYFRAIRQGRLHQALALLSRPDRLRQDIGTSSYWGRLVAAADLLGEDGDPAHAEAVQRCRDRLAEASPPVQRVVGAVVLDAQGRAFIQFRAPHLPLFPGTWDILGGHVEPGETRRQALAREITEETGWQLRRVVRDLGTFTWIGADGLPKRETDYVVEVDGDLASPQLEWDKHPRYAWIGPEDLPMLLENRLPGDTALRDVVAGALGQAQR